MMFPHRHERYGIASQGHPIEFVRKGMEIVFYVGDDD
jgi:hypothetical protein